MLSIGISAALKVTHHHVTYFLLQTVVTGRYRCPAVSICSNHAGEYAY